MRSAEDLLANSDWVAVGVPDHCGRLIGKRRPAVDWAKLLRSGLAAPDFHLITGLENRPLSGFAVTGEHTGFNNGVLMPLPEAAFVSPSEPGTAIVLAEARHADGRTVEESPRQVLARQVERLAARGLTARVATELEFYVYGASYAEVRKQAFAGLPPLYHRHGDNDLLVSGYTDPFHRPLLAALAAAGIVVEQIQGEGGTGQTEINTAPADPLTAADRHIAFKHVVKALAQQQGLAATFLAKPRADEPGSGGHVHLSLWTADGEPALGRNQDLSVLGRCFLAGLIAHSTELTLLHAPYVNSFRRLVPGSFTPLAATWAWDSRAVMVRLLGGAGGVRLEFRLPGADMNPYHSLAGILAAGLAGIEAGAELSQPPGAKSEEARPVPLDLTAALAAFTGSPLANQALGEAVHAHIARHAEHELEAFRRIVTAWEIDRGFEVA